MAEVNINFDGLAAYAWRNWSRGMGPRLVTAAREEAPRDTGELADSISYRQLSDRTGELRASAPHAKVVTTGRGEVRPRDPNGVLRWIDNLAGPVFAKRSGPVPANNFLKRAIQKVT